MSFRKIVFIDIDGVLTDSSCSYFTDNYSYSVEKLELLKAFLSSANAVVVWSTNWVAHTDGIWMLKDKEIHSLLPRLNEELHDFVIGAIPPKHGDSVSKYDRILEWISKNTDATDDFMIVDDQGNQGLEQFGVRFVQTTFDKGLTESTIDEMQSYFRKL